MEILIPIAIIVALVLANGLFVAAEFAIVKVRSTKVRELAEQGDWRAAMAKNVIEHLDAYLSACQLGITIASLGLGWIGEPAVARLIEPALHAAGVLNQTLIHTISFGIAFVIISFLHIVLGELAPKSLAIRKAERLSLWLSPPLRGFYWLMYFPIVALNGSANWILRILRIEPVN